MTFYTDVSKPFILDKALSFFERNGVAILTPEQAEELHVPEILDSVEVENNYLALPKRTMLNIPIPYEVLDHDDASINSSPLRDIITEHVNSVFLEEKYIISGRPDIFLALSFERFSYEILEEIAPGHLTTPMVLFDQSLKRIFFFEYDLAVNVYSRAPSLESERLGGKSDTEWTEYFNSHFLDGISYSETHISVINKYYAPVFEGVHQF